jgi:hypothetical protein
VATLAGVILITTHTVRSALTRQVGENFQTGAEGLNHLVGAFFLEKVGQIQTLAVTDSLRQALAERNASYQGGRTEALAQIQASDAHWTGARDDDPLIRRTTDPDPAANPVAAQLATFLQAFPAHTELFATDRFGATVGATGRLSDYYQADEAWWQAAWADGRGNTYISNPQFDESAGVAALLIAVPVVKSQGGEVIGVLRSTLIVDELFQLLAEISYGETGRAALLDGSGEILFGPSEREGGATAITEQLHLHLLSNDDQPRVAADRFGGQWLVAHARFRETAHQSEMSSAERRILHAVAELGWIVIIEQRVDEAFSSVEPVTHNILAAGVIAVALASLVARAIWTPRCPRPDTTRSGISHTASETWPPASAS